MKIKDIATPVKAISWADLIGELEVDQQRPFPFEKEKSIRPMISGRIALMYPDRTFETTKGCIKEKGVEKDVLIVKRTA